MGDLTGDLNKFDSVLQGLISKIDVLATKLGTISDTSNRISGEGFGQLNYGVGSPNVLANSFGNMSSAQILASSRAANLKYNSLIGVAQMAGGLFAGGNLMMPNMQQSISRGASFYNAGVFANTNYQGLATSTMNMMRGGITSIGSDAQTAQTLVGMGVDPNSAQYRNLVTSTSNAAKYLNMGNQQAAAAMGGLTQGGTSQSLMRNFGTWTTDPTTGRRLQPTEIFSQMYQRITAGQKLTRKDIMTSLQGGALSVDLQGSGMTQDQQNLFVQYAMDRASGKNMDLGSNKAMDKLFNQTNATVGSNPEGPGMQMTSATTGALNDALQPFVKGMQNAVPVFQTLQTASGALAKQFGALSAYIQTIAGSGPGQGAATAAGGLLNGVATIGGAMLLNRGLGALVKGKGAVGDAAAAASTVGRMARGLRVAKIGGIANLALGGVGMAADAASGQGWGTKTFSGDMGGTIGGTIGGVAGAFLGPLGAIAGGFLGSTIGSAIGGTIGTGGSGTVASSVTDTNSTFKLSRPVSASITLTYGIIDANHPNPPGHSGIDFGASSGTPVQAAADGVAKAPYWSNGIGNVVEIDHGNGYTTLYAHLSSAGVTAGMAVKRGQVIAASGNTGSQTTGAHLHFGLIGPSGLTNPAPFLEGGVAVNGGQTSLGTSTTSASGSAAGAAGSLGFSSDYTAAKTAGGIPPSYSGAAIAGTAAGGIPSSGTVGRGASVQGGAQGAMTTGTSNGNTGGGTSPVKGSTFNITVNIAQASESEARKFAQMIKGYIEQDTLTSNMGRL